jgi:hypothetical protein
VSAAQLLRFAKLMPIARFSLPRREMLEGGGREEREGGRKAGERRRDEARAGIGCTPRQNPGHATVSESFLK